MSGIWNPEFWSGLSGPAIAVFAAVAFVWALATGRLVTGKQHDAVVRKAEIDAESVRELSLELARKNGGDLLSTQLLTAVRELMTKGSA